MAVGTSGSGGGGGAEGASYLVYTWWGGGEWDYIEGVREVVSHWGCACSFETVSWNVPCTNQGKCWN